MIGIFDSGIGGLSVVRALLKRHPTVDFLYLGDTARTPYGNKSRETIIRYALEDVTYLVSRGATHVIVACNTVSATALPTLKERFPEIIFFDVVTPAVKAAVAAVSEKSKRAKHIGVIGTRATIASAIYEKNIHALAKDIVVVSSSCPLFVPLVEEGWVRKPETQKIARTYLATIRQKQVDVLILGCTHYPFLQDVIAESLQKRVQIIDSASALLNLMEQTTPKLFQHGKGERVFAFTDPSPRIQAIATRWLKLPTVIERAEFKTPAE